MSKQSFTQENLTRALKSRKYKSISVSKKRATEDLATTSEKLITGTYNLDRFHSYALAKKTVYCTNSQEDEAVLSKLDENIRKIYRVKQKDRHTAVKQLKLLLSEDIPKFIYKLDIEDFYSNINLENIKRKFEDDGILSSESLNVFNLFKNALAMDNINGVPRGIGLSASLAELAARPFDKAIQDLEGVYYYTRYVDDILIMSTKRLDIQQEIVPLLPSPLTLNLKKTRVSRVIKCFCAVKGCKCNKKPCRCWDKCKCRPCGCFNKCLAPNSCKVKKLSFDFLGYSFTFSELSKNTKNSLSVDIAESKYKKIKNRLYLSFKEYHKKGNFKKLEDRISFLTSNYYVDARKSKVNRIKSGVYYSYIHIDEPDKYKLLDILLKKLIYRNYSRKIILTDLQKSKLNSLSFIKGFENKYTFKFKASQINKIKSGWNNG